MGQLKGSTSDRIDPRNAIALAATGLRLAADGETSVGDVAAPTRVRVGLAHGEFGRSGSAREFGDPHATTRRADTCTGSEGLTRQPAADADLDPSLAEASSGP